MGVRIRSCRCPDCASGETSPGTPAQMCPPRALCATPERHCWSACETLGGRARDSERPNGISRRLMCVPVASSACPDESSRRRERDAVSLLVHGPKSLSVPPCRSPSEGTAAQPRNTGGATSAQSPASRRCGWYSAGATVGTGASSGRHGRAEEGRGRRGEGGSRPPHPASLRGTACFRGMARGVEEDQRDLLRKQSLEEDDNGPMTLELLAVPDGQAGRSSRASLLLMRPRRSTPG